MKYWFSDYIAPRLIRPLDWLADRVCHHWLARGFAGRCLIAHGYSGYRHSTRVGDQMWEIKVDSWKCRTQAEIEAEMASKREAA